MRCDSAAIVSKTSELLPEPETPVNTVSRRFGISTLTSLRLFTRAPSTRIRSCRSAACGSVVGASGLTAVLIGLPWSAPGSSAQFLDADHVARRVGGGPVPDRVGLLGRLLDDLGVAGLHLVEHGVQVPGGQQDPAVGA